MGVRQIRYCDISGVERDVDQHEIHIDQMRIEIDLAAPEYRKLLELLRPYLDAGRVEAAASGRGVRTPKAPKAVARSRKKAAVTPAEDSTRTPVGEGPDRAAARSSALSPEERQQVRQWAVARGMDVPANNRFKGALVDAWREETGGS